MPPIANTTAAADVHIFVRFILFSRGSGVRAAESSAWPGGQFNRTADTLHFAHLWIKPSLKGQYCFKTFCYRLLNAQKLSALQELLFLYG
jgi:hypothetical protein